MANPDICTNGVEVLCPAVYASDSAAEALSQIASEVRNASCLAYDTYGDGQEDNSASPISYFSILDDEEEED